jgi:hypothetical protein
MTAMRCSTSVLRTGLIVCAIVAALCATPSNVSGQPQSAATVGIEYKVVATTKTSTMEKELNEAAELGFHYDAVMGGETAFGGHEVVVVMSRSEGIKGRYAYKLLATSKTSTMQKELQQAAESGYEYRGQTIFTSAFGGDEVICILERDGDAGRQSSDYRLVATLKTSTLQKELAQAGAAGYQIVGMTVGKTAAGGNELVAITKRLRK